MQRGRRPFPGSTCRGGGALAGAPPALADHLCGTFAQCLRPRGPRACRRGVPCAGFCNPESSGARLSGTVQGSKHRTCVSDTRLRLGRDQCAKCGATRRGRVHRPRGCRVAGARGCPLTSSANSKMRGLESRAGAVAPPDGDKYKPRWVSHRRGRRRRMKSPMRVLTVVLCSMLLAACGSSGDSGGRRYRLDRDFQ